MKSILVPLDGSELAEKGLEPALRLARRHEARVHLVSVVAEPPPPDGLGDRYGWTGSRWLVEGETTVRTYLEEVRERLASLGGAVLIDTHVRVAVGRATRTILDIAREVHADLIVLTTHGRGAFERIWLGSIADQLIRSSPVPLLLLRGDGDTERLFVHESSPEHIWVPLDGSKAADSVLDVLGELVSPSGSRVTLTSVLDGSGKSFSVHRPDAASEMARLAGEREGIESYLETAKKQLESRGVRGVQARLLEGPDVARALVDACERSDADLIALSTAGRGGVVRFFVGSVADKLIRGSKLPVLVSRRAPA